eukprot:TRINITY_DN2064_c0_g1_i7.p2 TRINITY_DN2064_c0_g1~~TRINITY_DN2064_c0_g1_i7.p2  ORF type:complete len:113 (+),score=36.46 TRINITY_DN2064_c0_g1_i7:471-809(+)
MLVSFAGTVSVHEHLVDQQAAFWCLHTNGCADRKLLTNVSKNYERQQTGVRVNQGDVIEIERRGGRLHCKYNGEPYPKMDNDFFAVGPDAELVPVVALKTMQPDVVLVVRVR